jgi:hypothetical protein
MFEIWEDPEHNSFEMSPVSERGDKLRCQVSPTATRAHSFFASSNFEAYQMNHDWHGWGIWKPEPGWLEQHFTEEQALEQQSYLARRQIS